MSQSDSKSIGLVLLVGGGLALRGDQKSGSLISELSKGRPGPLPMR